MTDYYDRCDGCEHAFKPKALTKTQVENRKYCVCRCHWGDDISMGITDEQALSLLQKEEVKKANE